MSLFISYSHKDADFVDKLALNLIGKDIKVWKDKWKILTGDSFVRKIQEGIEKASFFCIVLSRNSLESEWVEKEIGLALEEENKNKKIKILLILIEECNIPEIIKDRIYVDFREDYTNGLKSIMQVVSRHYNIRHYGRVCIKKPDEAKSQYYLDYAFEQKNINEQYSLQIDIVSFDLEEDHSVLTQFFISGDRHYISECLKVSGDAPDAIRNSILKVCRDEFNGFLARKKRKSLNAQHPETASFPIFSVDGMKCFDLGLRVNWLGRSLGTTMVFNIGALFDQICGDLNL